MSKIIETIEKEILSWPYVTAGPHRFGGTEFCLNKKEMGHYISYYVYYISKENTIGDHTTFVGEVIKDSNNS